jgi:Protein of unknown function (DUF2971)
MDIFVASFSEDGNLLSQWRTYAASGGGYSIGLSEIPTPGPNAPATGIGMGMVRCIYDEGRVEREAAETLSGLAKRFALEKAEHVKDSTDLKELENEFLSLLFRHAANSVVELKTPAYKEEREWRLMAIAKVEDSAVEVKFRASPSGLVPYVELPLTESAEGKLSLSRVFVGPTQDPDRGCSIVQKRLQRLGYPGDQIVEHSGIPMRQP